MGHQKAAAGGDEILQMRLGAAHEDGEFGLEIDIKKALMLFQKAAGDSDSAAQ